MRTMHLTMVRAPDLTSRKLIPSAQKTTWREYHSIRLLRSRRRKSSCQLAVTVSGWTDQFTEKMTCFMQRPEI